jgi:alpha-mannosidase
MDFEDEQRAPRAFVSGNAKATVVEDGPARVSVAVVRDTEDSKFVQTISLSAGDAGNRVEFSNVIDWNHEAGKSEGDVSTSRNKQAGNLQLGRRYDSETERS